MQLKIKNSIAISMCKYNNIQSSVALDLGVSLTALRSAIDKGYEIYITEEGQCLKQFDKLVNKSVSRIAFCMALPINRWFSVIDFEKAWRDEGNDSYEIEAIKKRLHLLSIEKNDLLIKKIDAGSKKAVFYCSAEAFEKHVIGVKSL